MEDAVIVICVFGGIALVFKVIADAITRNKLIAKGMVDENVKYLFWKNTETSGVSNVKWGLVLVAIGVALLLDQYAPFYLRESSVFGFMFLFAGIAFLVYYFIAKANIKEQRRQQNMQQTRS
ncbi:MAG: hypothetical protein JSV52_10150 [Candidatus Zixiibacteriota bacterium]|nr:MAG: hypothetical protein JSV52_10150 [candidate division Zixibacteria bacterium]